MTQRGHHIKIMLVFICSVVVFTQHISRRAINHSDPWYLFSQHMVVFSIRNLAIVPMLAQNTHKENIDKALQQVVLKPSRME